MRQVHVIKAWPTFYEALADGRKLFEVRFDDRNYKEGDILAIQWFDPELKMMDPTKPILYFGITFKLVGGQFGLQQGFAALSLTKLAGPYYDPPLLKA